MWGKPPRETPQAREYDIVGARCELAFARYYGKPWVGVVNDFWTLPGDVGNVQIRGTRWLEGCLLLHPEDAKYGTAPFVLVLDDCPRFRIAGWTTFAAGALPQHWQEKVRGRPAYFVPQSSLREPPAGRPGADTQAEPILPAATALSQSDPVRAQRNHAMKGPDIMLRRNTSR